VWASGTRAYGLRRSHFSNLIFVARTPARRSTTRTSRLARGLNLLDSARFLALYATALTDAYIAVFDAKYHYEFWRPITAIRNGDIDENPDTEADATWQTRI
jgi:hypothetical protein